MFLWRISNHLSLAGDGGLRASGRWHTRGRRIVYCAENPAAALLEVLVHFELDVRDLPARYRLLKIKVPDDLRAQRVSLAELDRDWIDNTQATRAIGDAWLARGATALLTVPSAIIPETFNVLVNPAHSDTARITIAEATDHVIDPRLLSQLHVPDAPTPRVVHACRKIANLSVAPGSRVMLEASRKRLTRPLSILL